jgi:hypothetical protein
MNTHTDADLRRTAARHAKGVMISAFEIETAVLSEIGAGARLTSKEQQAAVREAVRAVVYDAAAGKVKIQLIQTAR